MSDDILREKLESGEQLIWSGSPAAGGDNKAKAPEPAVKSIYGIILKALMIPVVIATIVFFITFGRNAIISIPFWAAPFVLLFLSLRPEEYIYGITGKRIFVGTEKSGIASYSFGEISDIQQYIGKNGIGCVTFTADGQECGFYGLNETEKVCGILKAAKDNFLE